jgi:hypothetical protein
MSHLLTYLNKNHRVVGDAKALTLDFSEKFGVRVKQEGDLFLFSYMDYRANFKEPVTHECRGHILRHPKEKGEWHFVCRPFDKFFNLHERECPLNNELQLAEAYPDLWAVEKIDGTLICIWYDTDEQRFRASTLGTITPMQIGGHPEGLDFGTLFWRTLDEQCNPRAKTESEDPCTRVNSALINFHPPRTYLFEIWHPDIAQYCGAVTRYDAPRLSILAIRDNKTGQYLDPDKDPMLRFSLKKRVSEPTTCLLHTVYPGKDKMMGYLHDMAAESGGEFGDCPEGFVLINKNTREPLAKVKFQEWLDAHHLTRGNNGTSAILKSIFSRKFDDLRYFTLPIAMQQLADDLLDFVSGEVNEAADKIVALSKVGGTKVLTTNESGFAAAVFDLEIGFFENWCFKNKDIVASRPHITYVANSLLDYCVEQDKKQGRASKHFLKKYNERKEGNAIR